MGACRMPNWCTRISRHAARTAAARAQGELTFPDGGVLVVHKVAQPQYQLLTSQVRLRSLDGAL